MPTPAQDASITWGQYALTEVIDYSVDALVSYGRDFGDCGSVTIRSFSNAIPPQFFGYYGPLTIRHNGVVTFKAGCIAERVRIDAAPNDVLRYVVSFRILWPSRSYL